jgi:hypothetical protein
VVTRSGKGNRPPGQRQVYALPDGIFEVRFGSEAAGPPSCLWGVAERPPALLFEAARRPPVEVSEHSRRGITALARQLRTASG